MPLKRKIAPNRRTMLPIQSPIVHDVRQLRFRSPDQSMNSAASAKAAGIITSSPRTAGASTDAMTAAITQARRRVKNALAIRDRQSAGYGYATVSSTMYDEYASEGIAPAPGAAKSAALWPTMRRARKYVGNTLDAITTTSAYLIAE